MNGFDVAMRNRADDIAWDIAGYSSQYFEEELVRDLGLTAEDLKVLDTFPEPTLASVVGSAGAFWFGSAPDLAYRIGESWRVANADHAWPHASLEALATALEIDLATVVPLLPGRSK